MKYFFPKKKKLLNKNAVLFVLPIEFKEAFNKKKPKTKQNIPPPPSGGGGEGGGGRQRVGIHSP